METSGELEFVNRGAELAFLQQSLMQPSPPPPLTILRSPPGFGKSRLTEELASRSRGGLLTFCIVDPSIRAKAGAAHLYDGFFLQRCAAALSLLAETDQVRWPSLLEFLRSRRWQTLRGKKTVDAVAELPSVAHGYRLAFDYLSRIFAFGRFSPGQLLISDQSEALLICSQYVAYVLKARPIALVVRETQHIDLESLRSLLLLSEAGSFPSLIFEYTTDNGEFEPDHQKLFLRAAECRRAFDILDLVQLEPQHLECLIRESVDTNFNLTSDFYLSWNGNLRSVVELKFRVGVGRRITSLAEIGGVLGNLTSRLAEHVDSLKPLERLLLAVVHAHVEAIDRWTLLQTVSAIDERASPTIIREAINSLIEVHGFVSAAANSYRIQNDTVASAAQNSAGMRSTLLLADKALREHYARVLDGVVVDETGLATAVRQVFRLCARTKDVVGLMRAKEMLADRIASAKDQSVYVDIIAAAVEADPALYRDEADELLAWAAALAYEVSDWDRCATLLARRQEQTVHSLAMQACALQEVGKHDEALALAAQIANRATNSEALLAASLLTAVVIGCRGDHDNARRQLNVLIADTRFSTSALLGYAFRFYEITESYPECLNKLKASAEWFDRFSLKISKAYSQLPLAIMTARLGDVATGRQLMREAEIVLAQEVRDQHMILNNAAAIELLDLRPNFDLCRQRLSEALRLARDDHAELTILINLALCFWGASQLDAAVDCVERCIRILRRHDFADRDIYWPVCFNCGQIFEAVGLLERRTEILRFPAEFGAPVTVNENYWAFRYGTCLDIGDERYRYLSNLPRHPLYLSHWTLDIDGLNALKLEPLR